MQYCNWFVKLRVSVRSEQASPLTDRALEILDEIKKEKRSAAVGREGQRADLHAGRRNTYNSKYDKRRHSEGGVRRSGQEYRFHDYRNTALTDWARQGVNVRIAMKASGHTLLQMQRYLDLQREDIPKAFGLHGQGRRRGRVASS